MQTQFNDNSHSQSYHNLRDTQQTSGNEKNSYEQTTKHRADLEMPKGKHNSRLRKHSGDENPLDFIPSRFDQPNLLNRQSQDDAYAQYQVGDLQVGKSRLDEERREERATKPEVTTKHRSDHNGANDELIQRVEKSSHTRTSPEPSPIPQLILTHPAQPNKTAQNLTIPEPLSTLRLKPITLPTKWGAISINESGYVYMTSKDPNRASYCISPDGKMVC